MAQNIGVSARHGKFDRAPFSIPLQPSRRTRPRTPPDPSTRAARFVRPIQWNRHHDAAKLALWRDETLAPSLRALLVVLVCCADANGITDAGPKYLQQHMARRPRKPDKRSAEAKKRRAERPDHRTANEPGQRTIGTINRQLTVARSLGLLSWYWVRRGRTYRGVRSRHGFRVFTLNLSAIAALGDLLTPVGTHCAMDHSYDRSILDLSLSLPGLKTQDQTRAKADDVSPPPTPSPRAPDREREALPDRAVAELPPLRAAAPPPNVASESPSAPVAAPASPPDPTPEREPESSKGVRTPRERPPIPPERQRAIVAIRALVAARLGEAYVRARVVTADELEARQQAPGPPNPPPVPPKRE